MPGFVKTPKDEARWSKAKNAAKRSKGKDEASFQDQDWALVNHIYHQMGKAEELGKAVKDILQTSSDPASIEELKSFLEKARRRMSDEVNDADDEDQELGEGFREFDPDEESGDDADRWLQENDPEAVKDEEDEEDQGSDDEGSELPREYDEYGPDEDEDDHQQLSSEGEEPVDEDVDAEAPQAGSQSDQPQESPQEAPEQEEVTSGGGRFPQPSKEDINEMRQYTRPWESRARDTQRLTAEASKNPVLHHQGRVVEARQAAHGDRQAAYDAFQQSPEYKNADPISQMEMDAKFNQDWHEKNPEHLKNAVKLHERAHLHGLKGYGEHAGSKVEDIAHVRGGGAQPEEAMSTEAGMQHAGGSKGEEGTVGSTTQDPASAFANANQKFLQEKGAGLEARAGKRKGTYQDLASGYAKKVGEIPEYDRAEVHRVLGDHPALKDPQKKAKVDKFFEHYHPLIGMSAKKVMDKLGLDSKRGDLDMGALHEAGMHGLFQAINDYEHENPSKASFSTHASNKIRGLMQTALRDQQKIAPELKTGAKKYNLQSMLPAHGPDVGDRMKRINTFRQVHQAKGPKIPKPEGGGQQ